MDRFVRRLLRTASKFLNPLFSLCWLVPITVADDERILRAIYSPYHVNRHNKLKHQAYNPTPKTDEISVMRLEYMGARFCKQKAKSFENPANRKEFRGFAVINVGRVRKGDKGNMDVVDSRRHFCGHADIKLLIEELNADREPQEPPSAETTKRLSDLQDALLAACDYFPDPNPNSKGWTGPELQAP